jgi:hypothetical protein
MDSLLKILLFTLVSVTMFFLFRYWYKESIKPKGWLVLLKMPNLTREQISEMVTKSQDVYADPCYEIFGCQPRSINAPAMEVHRVTKNNEAFKDHIVRMSVFYGKDDEMFETYRKMAIDCYNIIRETKDELQSV